jgi:RNA polymerase sigma-70 factor, ECF subfamily
VALETHPGDEPQGPGPSDAERDLLARAKAGDYHAFEEIVRANQTRVYAVAMGVLKNSAEAEEVAQETFLSAFEHLDTFRGDAQLSSWLYRVATNHALMKLRKKKPDAVGGLAELEPQAQATTAMDPFSPLAMWARRPDEAAQQKEISESVQAALDTLGAEDRAMLVLRAFDGLSHQEIADAMHTTVPAVKSRLHRARLALRAFLQDALADSPLKGPA